MNWAGVHQKNCIWYLRGDEKKKKKKKKKISKDKYTRRKLSKAIIYKFKKKFFKEYF